MEHLAATQLPDVFSNFSAFTGSFTQMLYQWAGVENIAPGSRGPYLDDARKLEFMEGYYGQGFFQARFPDPNPLSLAAVSIQNVFDTLRHDLMERFIFQAGGSQLFATPGHYDFAAYIYVANDNVKGQGRERCPMRRTA